VGVLLIHALLVLPFVLSLSLPSPRRPDTTGAGATAFASAAEPEMTVVRCKRECHHAPRKHDQLVELQLPDDDQWR
jgi:hypothetical protein